MHLTFTNIISHACKYFNSEVAASRSEVMPIGIVKLLLRSSEVKCSAYRAEGTLHARSTLHFQRILHVPQSGTLSSKKDHICPIDKCSLFSGPPEGIRTPDLQNRNLLRYPTAPRTDIFFARLFYTEVSLLSTAQCSLFMSIVRVCSCRRGHSPVLSLCRGLQNKCGCVLRAGCRRSAGGTFWS